jgi:hypothetical protein
MTKVIPDEAYGLAQAGAPHQVRCESCGQAIGATDKFCRHCGRRQGKYQSLIYHPVSILLIALQIGPFALPLVWQSRRMDRTQKWVTSVAILLYTLAAVYVGYVLCMIIYRQFSQLMGMDGLM